MTRSEIERGEYSIIDGKREREVPRENGTERNGRGEDGASGSTETVADAVRYQKRGSSKGREGRHKREVRG